MIGWSYIAVVFFGLFAAAFSTMLHYVGVDLGWTLYMLGTSPFLLKSLSVPLLTLHLHAS